MYVAGIFTDNLVLIKYEALKGDTALDTIVNCMLMYHDCCLPIISALLPIAIQ